MSIPEINGFTCLDKLLINRVPDWPNQ